MDGGPGDSGDSGTTDGATGPIGSLVLDPPAPPRLTPCPTGFREVTDDGSVAYCDPWPATGHVDDCAATEAHFPGEPGCAPVGTACPADGFPADLPTDRTVVFVEVGARRGDGSRGSPYPDLAAVPVSTLPAGSVIALGVGAHVGRLHGTRDVQLIGACASGTTLRSDGSTVDAIVADGATVSVRNLRVIGPGMLSGIDAFHGGSLDLQGVVIEGLPLAMYIDPTSSLTARDFIVRDLVVQDRWGIYIEGTADITRAVVERAYNDAIQANGPAARVTLHRVALRETAMLDGMWGSAITALAGARIDVTEAAFEDNHHRAAIAQDPGSTVTLADVVVRGTRRDDSGNHGQGITVGLGATIVMERTLFDSNEGSGVSSGNDGGFITATDLIVRRGRSIVGTPVSTERFVPRGRGFEVGTGVEAEIERVFIEDNAEAGAIAHGVGALLVARDLIVRSTRSKADGTHGRGLNVQSGAHADLTRARIEENHEAGIFLSGTGTTLNLEESEIVRTLAGTPGGPGRTLNVQAGAVAFLNRVRISDSVEIGIASIVGGSVIGFDVEVFDTRALECSAAGCPTAPGGSSLVSTGASQLSLTRFTIDRGDLCGLQIANGSTIGLSEGTVAHHPIGACVQVDGFDISAISDDVVYVDNGTNLDSTSLPVPDAIEAVEP